MRVIIPSRRFERDLKRIVRRGKDPAKLMEVVTKLQAGTPLESHHRPHPLHGEWRSYWDCHIEPDWLLIYAVTDDAVHLMRTGTHAEYPRL